MADKTPHEPLRPEIPAVLTRLQGRIRRYVFWEGMATVLVVLSLFFWVSLALDYGFSVIFKMEFARDLRVVIALIAIGLAGAALVTRVLARMFRDFHYEALALVLERRFPQLNDRLITSVQLAKPTADRSPLTDDMLHRAVDEVGDMAESLPLREVFDFRPLKKVMAAVVLLAASIIGFAILFPGAFTTWYHRNVVFADEFWPRASELELVVLATPGERVRPFRDGVYKHPRGADLTLLASVPTGKTTPERVRMNYRFQNRGGGGDGYFSQLGESQFRMTVKGLQHSSELTITGGDYYNRRPYVVEVVDAPVVDRIVLDSLYPPYTRLNEVNADGTDFVRTPIAVQATRHALPVGTDVIFRADSNKPLTAARIQTASFTLDINPEQATLMIPSATEQADQIIPIAADIASTFFDPDGHRIAIPLIITGETAPQLLTAEGEVRWPLPLPVESSLLIELTDQDEVVSQQPTRLNLSGIVDEPPVVETRPKGIRNAITRQAVIPIEGKITDDYGIAETRFEYTINQEAEFRQHPFNSSANMDREFDVDESFDVLDLDLALGQKLTLSVVATDGDNLNGPHEKRSEATVFEIVSPEELLSLISARELNLRNRFEQILREVQARRTDLSAHRAKLLAAEPLRGTTPPPEQADEVRTQLRELDISVETVAQRSLLDIRKNANETASIEEAFADIHAELINNRVKAQRMLDRIEEGILKPLNLLNTIHYNNVDEKLGLFKLALDRQQSPFEPLDECIVELDSTIAQIEKILAAMLKLATINEARELLRAILEKQEELKKQTEQERKRKLIESLK